MCFTNDHSESAALAAFVARFGHAPLENFRDDLLRLGPVADDFHQAITETSDSGVAFSSVPLPGFEAVLVATVSETGQGEGADHEK